MSVANASIETTWVTMSRLRPGGSWTSMGANGSSRAPNLLLVRRTPLATARTNPCSRVSSVTIRSASPSLCWRSTTARSRYNRMHTVFHLGPTTRTDHAAASGPDILDSNVSHLLPRGEHAAPRQAPTHPDSAAVPTGQRQSHVRRPHHPF